MLYPRHNREHKFVKPKILRRIIMKKLSILVLICMLMSCVLMACDEAVENVGSTVTTEAAHTHAYGSDWLYSATEHYHICGCGEKSGAAAHADENKDGACDVCAATMSGGHVFDKAWTADETGHWHADLCGHDVTDGKAAHTANKLGNCSECGYKVSAPDVATIAKALEIAAIGNGSVKYGFIEHTTAYDEWDKSYTYYWYEFAENYLHVFDSSERANYYNTLVGEDEVFSLKLKEGEPVFVDSNATVDYMNGPSLPATFLVDYPIYYGATQMVEALYVLAADESNFTESVKDGVYTFEFVCSGDYYVNLINVTFTLDSDNYFIDDATVSVECYSEIIDVWGEEITNYTVVENNGKKTYTFAEDAVYSIAYAYDVEQSVDIINTHSPAEILPASFKLVDATGKEIDFTKGIEFEAGSFVINFADVTPSTALLGALGLGELECYDAAGNPITDWSIYAGFNSESNCITVASSKPGNYVVKFNILGKDYSLPVKVNYKVPDSIAIGVDGMYGIEAITEANIFTGVDFVLETVVDSGYNPEVSATITPATGATISKSAEGKYTFNATVAGEYKVKFVSTANANATAEVTITVVAPPTIEEIIAVGSYVSVDPYFPVTLEFVPTNATTGIVNVLMPDATAPEVFNYTITDGVFAAVAQAQNGNIEAVKIKDYKVYITDFMGDTEMVADVASAPVPVVGGTQSAPEVLEVKNVTYTLTLGAGEKAYFIINAPADEERGYQVDCSVEGAVAMYQTRRGESEFSYCTLDYFTPSVTFWIVNDTAEPAEVSFTFTVIEY